MGHGNCCPDYQEVCLGAEGQIVTVYHQTNAEDGALILKEGFKPGKVGWCGGAIYFAKTRAETYTKAIGPDSHTGFMIEARVDMGRVLVLDSNCTGHERVSEGYDSKARARAIEEGTRVSDPPRVRPKGSTILPQGALPRVE